MKPLPVLFAAIALLILAGCSTTRGVERTVRLNQNQRISQAAVIAAIQQTPGVILVKKQHLTPTTGYGVIDFHNKSTDRYVYVSDLRHADGVIEIGGNDRDGLRLKMYCLFQNTRPSAEQIAATRKLMDDIYANLRRQDPALPPPDKVHEDLMDVPVAAH
jgi:predicted small secreted protein